MCDHHSFSLGGFSRGGTMMTPRACTCRPLSYAVGAACLIVVLVLSGCATPVGVRPLDSKEANRRLTETVLSDDKLSAPTQQILNRSGLEKQFQSEPVEVIAALHKALHAAHEADRHRQRRPFLG